MEAPTMKPEELQKELQKDGLRTFEERMKESVIFVMTHLPDKEKNPEDVFVAAGAMLGQNGRSHEGCEILAEFVGMMPRCYGVERRKGFWRIAKRFVDNEDDLLEAYLSWVPKSITRNQRNDLQRYLVSQGFEAHKVKQVLSQFAHRDNVKSRNWLF